MLYFCFGTQRESLDIIEVRLSVMSSVVIEYLTSVKIDNIKSNSELWLN